MGLIRDIYGDNRVILTGTPDTYSGLTLTVSSLATPYEFRYNIVRRGARGAIIPIVQLTQRFCQTPLIIDNQRIGIYAMRRFMFNANYTYTYGSTTPVTQRYAGSRYKGYEYPQYSTAAPVPFGFLRIVSIIPQESPADGKLLNAAIMQRGGELQYKSDIPYDTIVDFVVDSSADEVKVASGEGITNISVNFARSEECCEAILWYIDEYGMYQPQLLKTISYGDTSHGNQPTRHYVSGARQLYPNAPTQRSFTAQFFGNKAMHDNFALTSGDVYYLGLPDGSLLPIDCTGVTKSGMIITFNGIVGL